MPNTTISFEFPEYKLKAIEQALRDKQEQKSVQDLMLEHVDGLYQRNVPAQARKYLDSLCGDPEQAATPNQTDGAQEPERESRRPYRRRDAPAQTREADPSAVPMEPQAPEPEPEQDMAMGM